MAVALLVALPMLLEGGGGLRVPSSGGAASVPPPVLPPAASEGPPMRFGFDADSLTLQLADAVVPDHATIWIGAWNLAKGWRGPAHQLEVLRAANVTPALQLYYWGDDLSPSCLEAGCQGKSLAGWSALVKGLAAQLNMSMGGAPVLVVLESEFNKGSVARSEPLDALLAEKAHALKAAYPAARVVLGLGGWNPAAWGTWDRAAAASDAVGVQAMAGAGQGTAMLAPHLFNATLAGVRRLHELFDKPIVLQDVAVPSGPSPATEASQADELAPFLANLSLLKAQGVDTILYRSFVDAPERPLTGYFGVAERSFGLAEAGTGALKPAGALWVRAMAAEAGP